MRREILLCGSVLGLCLALFPKGRASDVDAGTAVRLDINGLVGRAELVIEGRVRSANVKVAPNGLIETEYVIDVARTFEGADQATHTLRLPGGVLPSGDGLILPGMPSVLPGEDVIFFLTEPSGSGIRMPVGLAQGKFRVETNLSGSKWVTRRQGSLSVVDPVTGDLMQGEGRQVFDYAEVVAEIYAAVSLEQQGD